MKQYVNRVALFVMLTPMAAFAEDFNIEEELSPLPSSVEAVIHADKSFADYASAECKLVGKEISLREKSRDFVATTKDGCFWGASTGPIWVVHVANSIPQIVLADGGNSLTLGKQTQNGLRNLATSAGTAGWYSEIVWKFDGTTYIKVREKTSAPQ